MPPPPIPDANRIAIGVAQTALAQTQAALNAAPEDAPPAVEVEAPEQQAPEQPQPAPPDPTATITQTLLPSLTLTPEGTPTMTLTPTLGVPMVTVNRNTNCRTGPGEPYEIIGALLVGEEAEVVGISSDGGTWIIKNPDGEGECWLWGYYASVAGPTQGLPVRTPPPTPTPEFTWAGTWTTYNFQTGTAPDIFILTVTVDGTAFTGIIDLGADGLAQLNGTISADYTYVTGTWFNNVTNGTFTFFALGRDQFQGNGIKPGEVWEWCGGRNGAGMPVPCLKQ